MNMYSSDDIATYLRLYPDPVAKLFEDDNWWELCLIHVSKRHATYRAGYGHSIVENTRFVLQSLDVNSIRGSAIVLITGDVPAIRFAGWVRAECEMGAQEWVAMLNTAIKALLPHDMSTTSRPATLVDALVYDTQNEFAPDNPFGREILELDARGGLKYKRQRQVVLAEASGHVTPTGFSEIVEALQRASFPAAPQVTFVPGASVVRITTLPSKESADIDYFEALKVDGYREAVRKLDGLVRALRANEADVLEACEFTAVG